MTLSFISRATKLVEEIAALNIDEAAFVADKKEAHVKIARATGLKVIVIRHLFILRSEDETLQIRIRDNMKTIRVGRYDGPGATIPLEVIEFKLHNGVYER